MVSNMGSIILMILYLNLWFIEKARLQNTTNITFFAFFRKIMIFNQLYINELKKTNQLGRYCYMFVLQKLLSGKTYLLQAPAPKWDLSS